MFYHQIYAQIVDTTVVNIIVARETEIANLVTRKQYGDEALAIECTYWDCAIGDTYRDGVFYDSEGDQRQYKGDEIENINELQRENAKLKAQTSEDNETLLDHEFRLMELEG